MCDNGDYHLIRFEETASLIPDSVELEEGLRYLDHVAVRPVGRLLLSDNLAVITMVRFGSATFSIGGNRYEVRSGDMVIIQPGDIFETTIVSSGCEGFTIFASINRLIEMISNFDAFRYSLQLRHNPIVTLQGHSQKFVGQYVNVINEKLTVDRDDRLSLLTCRLMLRAFFIEVFDALRSLNISETPAPMGRKQILFHEFMELLNSLSVRPREVEWYADKLCVTPKYLSAACLDSSGKNASAWIKEYAMLDLKNHLKNSDLSVKEVAARLNYPGVSAMGKVVRRWFGMNATELRDYLRR